MKVKLAGRSALVQIASSSQKRRRRGYSPAEQMLALCETLIAGGECLDDAALLRADAAQEQLRGHAIPDPTTLGRFLASFNLGHIRQLDRALDQLFARVHPLLEPETMTLDLDATLVEHHGPAGSRQGARGTYTGKVAWHPLLCFVDETGEWLHGKLRNGHAAASTGAARFLRECLRRVPADAHVFLRADEFWGQDFFAELEKRQITYAIGAPQIASVKARIAEIPAGDWRRSSYRAGSEVASFDWQPKTWKRERRFVVRRDPIPTGEQLTLDGGDYHYYVLVTNDHDRSPDQLESWHRAKANVENRIKEAKLGLGLDNLPCRGFHANWAYLLCTLLAYNLLVWLKLLALPEREHAEYAKRLRFRFINVAATVGRSGRRLILRIAAGYPLLRDFVAALQRTRTLARAPA